MTSPDDSPEQDSLLIELLTEELPPKALAALGQAFTDLFVQELKRLGLVEEGHSVESFATPRRLACLVGKVRARAASRKLTHKLMPASVGWDAQGKPSTALLKKLSGLGFGPDTLESVISDIRQEFDGKNNVLFLDIQEEGASIELAAQSALDYAIAKLPIPKVMTYQLQTDCALSGWDSVQFVRPVRRLMALFGSRVLPLQALGLKAGNSTLGHRFEAHSSEPDGGIVVPHASAYEAVLQEQGAVIPSLSKRREAIAEQLQTVAASLSSPQMQLTPLHDPNLLDEVAALVERPNVLACQFDAGFLRVPQECLILTMKANQKYFPLLTQEGRLSHHFLVVSNIHPADSRLVVDGNERVIRPRLADAQFFYEQDVKRSLESRIPMLEKVVYHNQLGSQAQRSERVAEIARHLVRHWQDKLIPYTAQDKQDMDVLERKVLQAARLAKCDLVTDMVAEFPELQGIMGAYYARHEGLRDGVATAIEDHYKPRFAADSLPRNRTGTILALADKLETLVGMFGIGNTPTGDKDPFALRRHAIGMVRILVENRLPLDTTRCIAETIQVFGALIANPSATQAAVSDFVYERLAGLLREQGYTAQEVEAVLGLAPAVLSDVEPRLQAVRAFAQRPESDALAAANKRVNNILKKNDVLARSGVSQTQSDLNLLEQAEELALLQKMLALYPQSEQAMAERDYTRQLQLVAGLRDEVDAFFDKVMVMTDNLALREQRLMLLSRLQAQMNQVADISKLAS